MPMHDWTRVDAGIFHGFHALWIAALNNQLNAGLLPAAFYAYPEQHAARRRTLAIRHVSGHRLVAVIEIVSPSNKDRDEHVAELAGKIDGFLSAGVHVLLLDPFPPGSHDPEGMDAVIREFYSSPESSPALTSEEPLVGVSYCATLPIEAYLEQFAVGMKIPEMPLFFQVGRYINAPLEQSYISAFAGVPAIWRMRLLNGS